VSLDFKDTASAALTCRNWSSAAYSTLYSTVTINLQPLITAEKLVRTLSSSQVARNHLRNLVIVDSRWNNKERISVDWLHSLPSTVLSFTVDGELEYIVKKAAGAGFLAGLKSFHIHLCPDAWLESDRLLRVLQALRNVEICSLSLNDGVFIRAPIPGLPALSHLELCTSPTCSQLFIDMLKTVAPTLRFLHCSVYFGRSEGIAAPERQKLFRQALCPMPLLELLVIIINYVAPPVTPTIQDLDISNYYPCLRSIYINSGVDISMLLRRLPQTITTLGMTTLRDPEFPYDDLEKFLRHAADTHPSLAHLCFYRMRRPPAAIWELAEASNITIHLLRARLPLLSHRAQYTKIFPMVCKVIAASKFGMLLIHSVLRMIGNWRPLTFKQYRIRAPHHIPHAALKP
jgi:hypothetical protein